jgi:hypothetical protein
MRGSLRRLCSHSAAVGAAIGVNCGLAWYQSLTVELIFSQWEELPGTGMAISLAVQLGFLATLAICTAPRWVSTHNPLAWTVLLPAHGAGVASSLITAVLWGLGIALPAIMEGDTVFGLLLFGLGLAAIAFVALVVALADRRLWRSPTAALLWISGVIAVVQTLFYDWQLTMTFIEGA